MSATITTHTRVCAQLLCVGDGFLGIDRTKKEDDSWCREVVFVLGLSGGSCIALLRLHCSRMKRHKLGRCGRCPLHADLFFLFDAAF